MAIPERKWFVHFFGFKENTLYNLLIFFAMPLKRGEKFFRLSLFNNKTLAQLNKGKGVALNYLVMPYLIRNLSRLSVYGVSSTA
ncbi:MAG TPA: hypothetical protein EYP39_10840 [Ghiorsea sp.]|nr:hypothetical protein [Ghiorsea sp.]HIP07402.1 hypothetical protein [Mariprofundaceae bacterium]